MWETETEYKALQKETVAHPWLRFFARMLDLNLTLVLWKAFSALLLHYNSSNVFLGSLYDSYIAFFLLLMMEPLLLSTWGTTPGKKLFGLVIRDTSGNKLTYKKALARTWGVFGAGYGYNIPIYSLVRLYQSYKQCSIAEPLSWEEDTSYSIKNTKYYRRIIYASIFLLLIGIAYIIGLQAVMPIHRGELTSAQYAENCNTYMKFIGYGTFMKLDDTGNWVDKNPNLLTYSELPPHKIIVKDGKVIGIELEVEIKDGDLVSSYQNQQWIAIMGFVAAQREMNCFRISASDLVKAVQKPFENYTEYEAGIRVKNEIEYTDYSMSEGLLFPTGENPYFHMRFTLERMD